MAKAQIPATKPANYRTVPCSFFAQGRCTKGEECMFIHTKCEKDSVQKEKEPSNRPWNYKTSLCKYYMQGICNKGESCHFIHSASIKTQGCEIANTKVALCKFFLQGHCYSGTACPFLHVEAPRDDQGSTDKTGDKVAPKKAPPKMAGALGVTRATAKSRWEMPLMIGRDEPKPVEDVGCDTSKDNDLDDNESHASSRWNSDSMESDTTAPSQVSLQTPRISSDTFDSSPESPSKLPREDDASTSQEALTDNETPPPSPTICTINVDTEAITSLTQVLFADEDNAPPFVATMVSRVPPPPPPPPPPLPHASKQLGGRSYRYGPAPSVPPPPPPVTPPVRSEELSSDSGAASNSDNAGESASDRLSIGDLGSAQQAPQDTQQTKQHSSEDEQPSADEEQDHSRKTRSLVKSSFIQQAMKSLPPWRRLPRKTRYASPEELEEGPVACKVAEATEVPEMMPPMPTWHALEASVSMPPMPTSTLLGESLQRDAAPGLSLPIVPPPGLSLPAGPPPGLSLPAGPPPGLSLPAKEPMEWLGPYDESVEDLES